MPGRASQTNQLAAITKVIRVGPYAELLREHVRKIVASPAFKGSGRSREFLLFIVDKALAGQFDDLKERVLGVELFGREASYDTGDDAIVRVTASDVRRRLLRYYADADAQTGFRVEIPVGSYIPEFHRVEGPPSPEPEPLARVVTPVALPTVPAIARQTRWAGKVVWGLAGFLLGLAVWGISTGIAHRAEHRNQPWATILQPQRELRIIASDTEISRMQEMLGYNVSLSDYANRKYFPADLKMSADMRHVMESSRGVSMGTFGVGIALSIARLSFASSQHVSVVPARALQLRDFKGDNNFVMIGSPRSNPWVALLNDSLDFDFVFDPSRRQEVIRNKRPKPGEPSLYSPSARGWDTGKAFGIIAFVANPGQTGHILLLAGSSAEATEAAAKFAIDEVRLAQAMAAAGIRKHDPQPFEILLRVDTMAGLPNNWEITAFHLLR